MTIALGRNPGDQRSYKYPISALAKVATMAEKTDVLQFMLVRAPGLPDEVASKRRYVRDDVMTATKGWADADLFSTASASEVGKLVYSEVFCGDGDNQSLLLALLESLPLVEPRCPNDFQSNTLGIEALQGRTYLTSDNGFILFPERLDHLTAPLLASLLRAIAVLQAASSQTESSSHPGTDKFETKHLVKELSKIFGTTHLHRTVFEGATYQTSFATAKRMLFDALYLLYMLRRIASLNLQHIIEGLAALHAIEALAIDEFVTNIQHQGKVQPGDRALLDALAVTFSGLKDWDGTKTPAGFPRVSNKADLAAHFTATPVIHPLFAQLHRFNKPFNQIKPLGIGDLKVVKHWLCGYKLGEIAHIDNVLKSEKKDRVHRRLEKTEETFSFSGERLEETQRDTQSTDRFELKRESENVVKTDLSVNAGLNVNVNYQGTGYAIVSTVSGGFAYGRSQTEQNKVAGTFAREVVDKAVKRVQIRTTEQRSTTKLFETEETSTHTFDNKEGTGHISGIYRWLDKEYRAQLFNYGKRMMFEFVVPEPAAFLVESRLRSFEATLEIPRPPTPVTPGTVTLDFQANQITQEKFDQLRFKYDLGDLTFPLQTRRIAFKNQATGEAFFLERTASPNQEWITKSFRCDMQSNGYEITAIRIDGSMYWNNRHNVGETPEWKDRNFFGISINGKLVYLGDFTFTTYKAFLAPNDNYVDNPTDRGLNVDFQPFLLTTDVVDFLLEFQEVNRYSLTISADLRYSATAMEEWQKNVYKRVLEIERRKVDAKDRELEQAYQGAMATYQNRLGEIRATAIKELLQGQSEAFNRQVILQELKRQCLAMITKEFAADALDDVYSKIDAMGSREVDFRYRQLKVKELPNASAPTGAEASFEDLTRKVKYSVLDLTETKKKGRYIQFLEQAFEWQQLSYLCYPYFWATPPKWIELMNRSDDTDPFLSAFLQAGSARILVAVTPAYDDAVLHYLATGEPWEGGAAPVIGDPLYIPLYEELREQQDDLLNAKAEGQAWHFTLPTSLVYLENSSSPLPPSECPDAPA